MAFFCPIRAHYLLRLKARFSQPFHWLPLKGSSVRLVFDNICLFLLLDIFSDNILINPDCTYIIPSCPQMPAVPLFHLRIAIKSHYSCLSISFSAFIIKAFVCSLPSLVPLAGYLVLYSSLGWLGSGKFDLPVLLPVNNCCALFSVRYSPAR